MSVSPEDVEKLMTPTTWLYSAIRQETIASRIIFTECLHCECQELADGYDSGWFAWLFSTRIPLFKCNKFLAVTNNVVVGQWVGSRRIVSNFLFDFLQCNTSDAHWEMCLKAHSNLYSLEQQGGSLIFITTMTKIQCNNWVTVHCLQKGVKKKKLTFDGKYVDRVVTLLCGIERSHLKIGHWHF